MYKNFKLVTLILNVKGGESQTIESLTKEVDGVIVPKEEYEAELEMFKKLNSVGSNSATQSIRCMLLNPNGDIIKVEEVTKPIVVAEE